MFALPVLIVVAGVSGCGHSARHSYSSANEHLFAGLPRPAGTVVKRETSTPYRDKAGSTLGYLTRFELALPRGRNAWAFFTTGLRPGWLWLETWRGPILTFRRARALVSINLQSQHAHLLEITVDHAYYGKLNRCGSPGGCSSSPAWNAIQHAILACKAKTVSQTHARTVTITLKRGGGLEAKEPRIDAVLDVINAANCQPPATFATE